MSGAIKEIEIWELNNSIARIKVNGGSYAPGATLTMSVTNGVGVFEPGHVGAVWELTRNNDVAWFRVTGYSSAQEVTVEATGSTAEDEFVPTSLRNTSADEYREGAWSYVRGFPRSITFFEERLIFAGSRSRPQTIWGSRTGDFENFADGPDDDNAVTFAVAAGQINIIEWLASLRALVAGTAGGEFSIAGASNQVLSPGNVRVRRESTYGVNNLPPLFAGNALLYLQRAGRKLRQLGYSFEVDGFDGSDLSLLAEHITESGVVDIAYQQEPDGVVWCVLGNGELIGLTYQPEHEVIAWHRHPLTNGAVESVAVIPDGGRDELWLVVRREIDGVTQRYVEVMAPAFYPDEADTGAALHRQMIFADAAWTHDGAASATIGGGGELDHLEGEDVAVLADGIAVEGLSVNGGTIELATPAAVVTVGLPYTSEVETLSLEAGAQDGTAQGKIKRLHKVTLRLQNSAGLKAGPPQGPLDPVAVEGEIFTGDVTLSFPAGYETPGRIAIRQDEPLPFGLLAVLPRLATFDGG